MSKRKPPGLKLRKKPPHHVILAKAGIPEGLSLEDSRFRGNDGEGAGRSRLRHPRAGGDPGVMDSHVREDDGEGAGRSRLRHPRAGGDPGVMDSRFRGNDKNLFNGRSLKALPALLLALWVSVAALAEDIRSFSDRADLPRALLRSGVEFLTPETQALQADAFANPGYLWVDRGRVLFKPCESCHADSALAGAATRYPAVDEATGELLDLTARINQCREAALDLPTLPHESDDMLALTAYVTQLSRGRPFDVTIDGKAARFFEAGRNYFFRRRGQLNLACNQCHDDNWGKLLRGDVISQGHPNAWPGYRLEWQSFGSLHRRLQDCDAGVRAEPFPAGSSTYRNLELYLAWRAGQLELESPGVRR